jgi:hypothetical protein
MDERLPGRSGLSVEKVDTVRVGLLERHPHDVLRRGTTCLSGSFPSRIYTCVQARCPTRRVLLFHLYPPPHILIKRYNTVYFHYFVNTSDVSAWRESNFRGGGGRFTAAALSVASSRRCAHVETVDRPNTDRPNKVIEQIRYWTIRRFNIERCRQFREGSCYRFVCY